MSRFYKNEYPEQDDCVIARITAENEYGYNCCLLEYNNMEGFIINSELVKGKYVKKHLLKKDEICTLNVIKVDHDKKIVDLSKKRITEKDKEMSMSKFDICTKINKLVAECNSLYSTYCQQKPDENIIQNTLPTLMNKIVWKHYKTIEDNDGFNMLYRNLLQNPDLLLLPTLFVDDFIHQTKSNLSKRITNNELIMESSFTCLMLEDNAVDKIKSLLTTSLNNIPNAEIVIASPPLYKLRVTSNDETEAKNTISNIQKSILDNSKEYSTIIKFNNPQINKYSEYKIDYLSNYDLQKFKFD